MLSTSSNRVVAGLAALILVAATAGGAAQAAVKTGDRAAEFTSVVTPRGKRLKLKSYRGKIVVLTFGASWCKPCKKELPAYEKLAKKFKRTHPKDVVFIAVNIDSERENADRFIAQTGVKNVQIGLDPSGGTVATYEPETMPSTYIIDERGIVRKVHRGYERGDEQEIESFINGLLDDRGDKSK